MVLDRRSALAGVLLLLAVAGCDGSHSSTAHQLTTSPPATVRSSPASTRAASTQPASTLPASTTPSPSAPAATSLAVLHPPPSTVTVPAHLCSGMDAAQNAADAYLGALSAGNAAEAIACVLPNAVPESLTRSLLATTGSTAVYLPRDGVDGPTVFGYQGNGKLIDVTVSKQPDGRFRVTRVVVRGG
ncbi:hypothetical protein [Jatrophihabitans sp.]|jgi:hypothetical protein|uniref:hypothetical protein n=1 Tax=Jatrophihabitans sp. TaxID=1932789 RepID=UPI002F088FF0